MAVASRRSALRDSIRHGASLGIALSLHLMLLLLVLRPAAGGRSHASSGPGNRQVLHVRLLSRRPARPSVPVVLPTLRMAASSVRIRSAQSRHLSSQAATQRPERISLPLDAPIGYTGNRHEVGDGGFHKRLGEAQGAAAIHGVPGSSRPFVAGIHLIDPGEQGTDAVMRKAQRLFGITNRHCMDIAAWRQLTPRELDAQHLSLGDLDQIAEKYHCNAPLGLSF